MDINLPVCFHHHQEILVLGFQQRRVQSLQLSFHSHNGIERTTTNNQNQDEMTAWSILLYSIHVDHAALIPKLGDIVETSTCVT